MKRVDIKEACVPKCVLSKIRMLLECNRLGELLVFKGLLTPRELRHALAHQKLNNAQLGRVLVKQKLLTRRALYKTLVQQWGLRCLAAILSLTISFSGITIKSARAGTIPDVPARVSLAPKANAAFAPIRNYPALFGWDEKPSGNLSPFTKWTNMFSRFDAALNRPQNEKVVREWQENLKSMQGLPLTAMAQRVNTLVNSYDYILDKSNWGRSDYWETPVEFFARGSGDCEDFAIAKYASLRALGVPEERLRVAIVHDKVKDIPHAILIVYTDGDALVLDNQNKQARSISEVTRYRPIFSINRTAWWLHTAPGTTVVASR